MKRSGSPPIGERHTKAPRMPDELPSPSTTFADSKLEEKLDKATDSSGDEFDRELDKVLAADIAGPEAAKFFSEDAQGRALFLNRLSNNEVSVQDAMVIVQNHPDLARRIRMCIDSKKFGQLRHDDLLKKKSQLQVHKDNNMQNVRRENKARSMRATKTAWAVPYKGNGVGLFLTAINKMIVSGRTAEYGNSFAIVQSSGTGKSRMVDEAAKLVFTLPINLRSDEGYPRQDTSLRSALIRNDIGSLTRSELELCYLILFTDLFNEVSRILKSVIIPRGGGGRMNLTKMWYNYLNQADQRDRLYSVAAQASIKPLNPGDTHENLVKRVVVSTGNLIKILDDHSELAQLSPSSANSVRFIIYFDESQGLQSETEKTRDGTLEEHGIQLKNEDRMEKNGLKGQLHSDAVAGAGQAGSGAGLGDDNPSRTAYQVLCRVLNTFRNFKVFFVFLSTNSSLAKYSPPPQFFWSDRVDPLTAKLQPPFVELPFDVGVNIKEGQIGSLDEVSTPRHMVQFGRPLFWTRYIVGVQEVKDSIFNFAQSKVFGSTGPVNPLDPAANDGLIAAASIRVMFDFEPRREEATQLEGRLVQGHMRIAFSVPAHREYLRSGTPSEPVLAEAAARILNSGEDHQENHTLNAISRVLSNGLISKGERGELVARLLLTLAHDKCIKNTVPNSSLVSARYSQPISLLNFLEALVGKEHMKKIKKAKPCNMDGKTFEEAFEDAKVNFTHFVKGADSSIISDFAAWAGLVRSMGYQCANGQYLVDLLIPILLWDEALDRWVTSAIFIQVKNRLNPRPLIIDVEKLGFFSNSNEAAKDRQTRADARPYIVIVMELGVRHILSKASRPTPSSSTESMASQSKLALAEPPGKTQPPRAKKKVTKPRHPRYALTIVGCSHNVYDVIAEGEKAKYASLLTVHDILDEHPRQSMEFRQAVLSLKPYWSQHIGSYDWTRLEDEETELVDEDTHEEVVVEESQVDEEVGSGDEDGLDMPIDG